MVHYLYDAHQVRYALYQTNGGANLNWIFLPGGPGADSSYFCSLVDELELPGNVWLVDLPGNGSNVQEEFAHNYDAWMDLFPSVIERFENPVLVGQSFGGMFPLLFPELEDRLKGFVILNSAPSLWMEEAAQYSKQFDLPDLRPEMEAFTLNPNLETFNVALDACMPYYFPKESLERGRVFMSQIPFQWQAAVWWQRKAIELNFSAKWVPQHVPTLIIGAKYDCICPFSLFQRDERFSRPNIQMYYIDNAGHASWIENPVAVRRAFDTFCTQLKAF